MTNSPTRLSLRVVLAISVVVIAPLIAGCEPSDPAERLFKDRKESPLVTKACAEQFPECAFDVIDEPKDDSDSVTHRYTVRWKRAKGSDEAKEAEVSVNFDIRKFSSVDEAKAKEDKDKRRMTPSMRIGSMYLLAYDAIANPNEIENRDGFEFRLQKWVSNVGDKLKKK